jgi:LDH2 family malate/lactate/ureidoglycolate dehydrogenase
MTPDAVRTLATEILAAAGLPADHASTVADVLVYADARGIWSHGVYRLDNYVTRIMAGGVNRAPAISVRKAGGGTISVDGDHGMGPVVALEATRLARETASRNGVAVCAVGRSGHFGMASYYAEAIAEANQIGIVWTTTSAIMAPWGGAGRVLGNNPIAIAIPTQGSGPIVLDMALSVAAGGRIRLSAERGEPIPSGWALDSDGNETTDASAATEGTLIPIGGHKGSGLSFMTEAIAVGLVGGMFGFEAPDLWADPTAQQSICHVVIAVDIGHFPEASAFHRTVDRLTRRMRHAAKGGSDNDVLLPGEVEARRFASVSVAGLQLPESSVRALNLAAERVGVKGMSSQSVEGI